MKLYPDLLVNKTLLAFVKGDLTLDEAAKKLGVSSPIVSRIFEMQMEMNLEREKDALVEEFVTA